MKLKPLLIIGGLIGLIIVGAVGWYLISPLFIDNTVDEEFPFEAPAAEAEPVQAEAETEAMTAEDAFAFEMPDAAEIEAMPAEERAALEAELVAAMPSEEEVAAMPEEEQAAVEQEVMEAAALVMMDKEMEEEMMAAEAEWVIAGQGQFSGADDFHQGSGSATIFQQGEQRVLRFEDFSVTNGPDLHVLLIENANATSSAELGEYIDLGSLKGNMGNQNYEIPADVDLSQYSGVMIYCMPFHVAFATAPLN